MCGVFHFQMWVTWVFALSVSMWCVHVLFVGSVFELQWYNFSVLFQFVSFFTHRIVDIKMMKEEKKESWGKLTHQSSISGQKMITTEESNWNGIVEFLLVGKSHASHMPLQICLGLKSCLVKLKCKLSQQCCVERYTSPWASYFLHSCWPWPNFKVTEVTKGITTKLLILVCSFSVKFKQPMVVADIDMTTRSAFHNFGLYLMEWVVSRLGKNLTQAFSQKTWLRLFLRETVNDIFVFQTELSVLMTFIKFQGHGIVS